MRDPSAMGIVVSYIKDIQEKMGNDEEETARLMPMYQFFLFRLTNIYA